MNDPHGNYSIKIEGSRVYAHADAPFNTEGISLFFDDLSHQVKHLDHWVLISSATADVGATPEAVNFYNDKLALLAQIGCVGAVATVPNRMLAHLIKKIYDASAIPQLTSDNPEEVESFVRALLAPYES